MRFHIPGLPHTVTNKKFVSCYSDDTELLTEDGWRSIAWLAETNAQTRVATLNPVSDRVEYHIPSEWIVNDYEGKMFHQKGQSIDFLITPEHRMWCRTASELQNDKPFHFLEAREAPKIVQHRRDFPWQEGEEKQTFELPSYQNKNCAFRPAVTFPMDKWLRLLGIYLAEGWVEGTSYATSDGRKQGQHIVGIAQENEQNRNIIREWLFDLQIKWSEDEHGFRICDVQFASWFSQFGKSKEKYIPREFKNLSKRQLGILLDAMILGDGWKTDTYRQHVSYSKDLANDVSEIAIKLGYAVTQYDDPNPDVPRHIVTISENQKRPLLNNMADGREWLDYKGKVYCLNVQNHIVYMRRNGKSCFSSNCAYTQKVWKLCEMLHKLGHEVYHYGCAGSDPTCTEQIDLFPDEFRQSFYPDTLNQFYKYDTNDELHQTFYRRAIEEIQKRAQAKDFLLCAWGWGHQPITVPFNGSMIVVESGIGYDATFSKFRIFESYAWMHYIYGTTKQGDGSYYDAVIPNFFDIRDFEFKPKSERKDYFLYLGRLILRKGVDVAAQVCDEIGAKLIMAGQGQLKSEQERIDLTGHKCIEFVGIADIEKRKQLMSEAKGLFMPTFYIEPFGGVNVEAQISGCPVITSDWGAFPETVLHGITGYRCRTFSQFVWAAQNIGKIDNQRCRDWAVANYSMERIAPMYDEYFRMCYDLWDKKGWYMSHPERAKLDWLTRYYPE